MILLNILKIHEMQIIERSKQKLISMSLTVESNILNINKNTIIFRRVVQNNNNLLLQDNDGYVYALNYDDVKSRINNFIEDNKVEIIEDIIEHRIPRYQTGITEVKESPSLEIEYDGKQTTEKPEMIEIPFPKKDIASKFLLRPRSRLLETGQTSVDTMFRDLEIDPRLDEYSELNYIDLQNHCFKIAKRYTYINAEEIESLFITDKNKTVLFLNSRGGLSVFNDDMSNFDLPDDVFSNIFDFFNNSNDHCSVEIENIDGKYQVSAIYEKYSYYSWARIPKENFKKYSINI